MEKMVETLVAIAVLYGAVSLPAFGLWLWLRPRKFAGFTSVRLVRGYSSDTRYRHVVEDDAAELLKKHQSGNRGPILLRLRGGAESSVDVGEFKVIEIGT